MKVPEILQYSFMRHALYAGLFASIIFGVIGTYVVVKRIVSISGGIAHASFGGVGLAIYLGWNPLLGALIFAVTAALGIGLAGKRTIQREDTVIGIVWAIGMALGAFFYYLTPGYQVNPTSFLFGNILMIGTLDIYLLAGLSIVILGTVTMMYYKLQAVSFDEDFAKVVGLNATSLYLFILVLVALSIVLLIKFVGMILVIAMLAIPASIASEFTHDLRKIMLYSTIFALIFIVAGLALSYQLDIPAGPTIILLAGMLFAIVMLAKKSRIFDSYI